MASRHAGTFPMSKVSLFVKGKQKLQQQDWHFSKIGNKPTISNGSTKVIRSITKWKRSILFRLLIIELILVMLLIAIFMKVNRNDNCIGDFPYLKVLSLSVLLQQQEQVARTGPNVKGLNIGNRKTPGKRHSITKVFLKPIAMKVNTIA